jgi:hypothetical protein
LPRTFTALLLAAFACLPGAFGTPGQDDEIVKEFNQYFRKYKDTPTRVEAVLSLEGTDSPAVVQALVPVLKQGEPEVIRAAVRVLGRLKNAPAIEAVLAELSTSKDAPTKSALLQAVAEGRYPGSAEPLTALLTDKVWDVRRRAVQALVALGDPVHAPAIAPLTADGEPAVRCAALEGLGQLGSELAVQPALASLSDSVWQVRASAVEALKRVRRREAIGPLIERMALEEGRLVADIGVALADLTGRNFGERTEAWQRFWETYKDRFQIPTDAELAKLREKQAASEAVYHPPGSVSYHGIETPSRSILFIIDVSGSMEALVVERERFQDGGYPSLARIDIVKTELARTVEKLEPYVQFNILAFATDVKTWKKGLVGANVLNKSSAMDWVNRLQAIGGSSKEDLARAGLVGSANLEAGKTNTYAALITGLGAAGQGSKDPSYQVAVDTIFFLSDGRPSHGDYVDPQDILREVRTANELRKVVIHTIAIGEFQKEFMKQLADENGGIFVDLGR